MIAAGIDSFLYGLVALLVIIDPAGTAALFISLTPRDTARERAQQAMKACVIALVVLTVFGLAGPGILVALGISVPALKAAGGVLLFLTAAEMVSAKATRRVSPEEQEAATVTEDDISVFPLAIPLIAGPGAITTMVLLHARAGGDWGAVAGSLLALVVAVALTLAALLSAQWIARALGATGTDVIGRVLGVLLAALAAEFVLQGVREAMRQM